MHRQEKRLCALLVRSHYFSDVKICHFSNVNQLQVDDLMKSDQVPSLADVHGFTRQRQVEKKRTPTAAS